MTDKELEQIYEEGYKSVYWTAMSFLKNEDDAEDIVQDVFVTLIKSYETIREKSKVLAWLKKTAANKCLDKIKLNKTDYVEDEFFDSIEALPEDFLPDSLIESDEARAIIVDIINNSLSEDIRRTLIMFYFNEMSTKEISEALGVPAGTVSWKINFAKKTIKKEVEKYEEKNKTKLFGMGLPFLTKLFMKEAEQVSFKSMPASLSQLLTKPSASAQTLTKSISKKTMSATTKAAKEGTGFMLKKVLIGSVATLLAGSAAAVIFQQIIKEDDKPKPRKRIEQPAVAEETSGKVIKIETTSAPAVLTAPPTPTPPVKPTMKLDGTMAQAVYDALIDLIYDRHLPHSDLTSIGWGDSKENEWALCDIDSDGKQELIIYLFSKEIQSVDYTEAYICGYDESTGKWNLELQFFTDSKYYDNGVIISTALNYSESWKIPFTLDHIYVPDATTDQYTYPVLIQHCTRDIHAINYPNSKIPSEFDEVGNDEMLYGIYDKNQYVVFYGKYVNAETRDAVFDAYINGANEVFPEFMPVDEDFITNYVQNMHY